MVRRTVFAGIWSPPAGAGPACCEVCIDTMRSTQRLMYSGCHRMDARRLNRLRARELYTGFGHFSAGAWRLGVYKAQVVSPVIETAGSRWTP